MGMGSLSMPKDGVQNEEELIKGKSKRVWESRGSGKAKPAEDFDPERNESKRQRAKRLSGHQSKLATSCYGNDVIIPCVNYKIRLLHIRPTSLDT